MSSESSYEAKGSSETVTKSNKAASRQSKTGSNSHKSAPNSTKNSTGSSSEAISSKSSGSASVILTGTSQQGISATSSSDQGQQAQKYNVGDRVFVRHAGHPWPARIEDPSNVKQRVNAGKEYAVFLYGIHERIVAKHSDVFLYDENRALFGGKSRYAALNMALMECMTNPDANLQSIPRHKRKLVQYLMKSRSHTLLDRYLNSGGGGNYTQLREEVGAVNGSTLTGGQFHDGGLITYDSFLGYFAIISSLLFMVYMTWWILLMPFLEPGYHSLLEKYFPNPSYALMYPITGGTIVACSIICYVHTQLEK